MSEVERLTDEVKGKADDKAGLAREEIENAMKRSAAETTLSEFDIPDGLKENMTLFLRLTRKVIGEYDEELCDTFDALLADAIMANLDEDDQTDEEVAAFSEAVKIIDDLPVERATLLMRGFATYFHLANI